MTLADASLIAEIAGAAAVFMSLIFVGFQVRQQTDAMRAQTEQSITADWMALGQLISENAEAFAAGLSSRDPAFVDLDEADRMRFLATIFALFKHYENMYMQFHRKRIDDDEWAPWSNHIRAHIHQPGVQNWWAAGKTSFAPAFRAFLDSSVHPPEPGPAQLHRAGPQAAGAPPQETAP